MLTLTLAPVTPTKAQRSVRLENPIAVFAALDKVTARISKFQIPLNKSINFGALTVTPRVCYSRPPTEPPKTTSFVEVEEQLQDGKYKKIFSGWMFAESPGLNAVQHPVYDIWLTACLDPNRQAGNTAADPNAVDQPQRRLRRRRVRR
ncbi:MAG: DUF2155 domain-containing protein [Pseudomonadota bacterium]